MVLFLVFSSNLFALDYLLKIEIENLEYAIIQLYPSFNFMHAVSMIFMREFFIIHERRP